MRKLRAWLRSRDGDLGEEEILRIWKGLFYCFWMSDKPLVQGSPQINLSTSYWQFLVLELFHNVSRQEQLKWSFC